MNKIIFIIFLLFLEITVYADLTVNNIPKTKTGGSNPALMDSTVVDNSGKIGIGTDVSHPPATLLSVGTSSSGGSITHNAFNVDSNGNITNLGGIQCNINAATVDLTNAGSSIRFGNNSGTAGSNVDIHTSNSTGYITLNPGTDSEIVRVTPSVMSVAAPITATSLTTPNATGSITAQSGLYLDPNGHGPLLFLPASGVSVGIGTVNPDSTLQVIGNIHSSNFSGSSSGTNTGDNVVVGSVVGTGDVQTLTNKRITKRVITAADATSITPNTDNTDITYQLNTQGSGTLTINADAGTPTNGQSWILKIKSTNVQTYSWNSMFVGGSDASLPTVTTASKIDNLGFIYDTVNSKWECVAAARGY